MIMESIIKRTSYHYKDTKHHAEWSKCTEEKQVEGFFTFCNRETEGIRKMSRS